MPESLYLLQTLWQVIGEVTGVWERQGVVCMSSSIGAIETVVDFVDADADIQIGQFVRLRFELTEAWLIEYNNRAKNMKPPATPRRRVAVKGTPADQCFVAEGRIAYETIVNEVSKFQILVILQAFVDGTSELVEEG